MAAAPPAIPFNRPADAPRAGAYLEQVLSSGRLSGDGPFTERASELLSARLDGAGVLLTPSCTHALEMSALLLDVGPGDEVVLPAFTFPSTATAFALRGATLRFADIDPQTWSMGPAQVAAVITDATRVVVAVHYGGVGCDPAGLAALCEERGVALVEDAAQGLFARAAGRPLGTFGALGALSFHETKNVTAGEGGALILGDGALRQRAEVIREKGTNRAMFFRGEVDKYTWRDLGSSWLPSELQAALLVAQLEAADGFQERRQRVWGIYAEEIGPHAARLGIELQGIPAEVEHPAHLFGLLAPQRERRAALLVELRKAGIHATSHFEPLHRAPAAGPLAAAAELPTTDDVASRIVRLPLHTHITDDDARGVAHALIVATENQA